MKKNNWRGFPTLALHVKATHWSRWNYTELTGEIHRLEVLPTGTGRPMLSPFDLQPL